MDAGVNYGSSVGPDGPQSGVRGSDISAPLVIVMIQRHDPAAGADDVASLAISRTGWREG